MSTRPRRLGRFFRQPQELGGCEPALQTGPVPRRPAPRPSPRALVQPLVRVGVTRLRTFSLGLSFLTQKAYTFDSSKVSNRHVKVHMKSVSTPLLRPPSSCRVSGRSFQKFPRVCRYRRAHQAWLAFYTGDSSLHGAPLPLSPAWRASPASSCRALRLEAAVCSSDLLISK